MLRHVALFAWASETTVADRQAVVEALAALPQQIPEIRGYCFGPDVAVNAGNHDFAVVADFDDLDGYLAYRDHPTHQRVLREVVGPFLAGRAAVQFESVESGVEGGVESG